MTRQQKYRRTKLGLATTLWHHLIRNSKHRNHDNPDFTKYELLQQQIAVLSESASISTSDSQNPLSMSVRAKTMLRSTKKEAKTVLTA